MLTYSNGTVFNQKTDAIVNTVNTVGVMGAGLALEFALRSPAMLSDYEQKCKNGMLSLGKMDYYDAEDILIINFPTKWHFKYPSKIEWIEEGLRDFVRSYKSLDISSVAFPRLGTRNGGLDWKDVKDLMEKYLSNLDIDVIICLDNSEAEGLEKEMIDRFNSTDFSIKIPSVRLNAKQVDALNKAKPIAHFWQVKEIEGIGITCYTNLYNHFKQNNSSDATQIAFF